MALFNMMIIFKSLNRICTWLTCMSVPSAFMTLWRINIWVLNACIACSIHSDSILISSAASLMHMRIVSYPAILSHLGGSCRRSSLLSWVSKGWTNMTWAASSFPCHNCLSVVACCKMLIKLTEITNHRWRGFRASMREHIVWVLGCRCRCSSCYIGRVTCVLVACSLMVWAAHLNN